jgi:hypothetical protein
MARLQRSLLPGMVSSVWGLGRLKVYSVQSKYGRESFVQSSVGPCRAS